MLSFSLSPLLLALCLLLAAGLTYWSYHRTVPQLALGRRLVLGSLRFVSLFIVLFLLFEPILRRVERQARPPVLAVLLDDSQSLRLTGQAGDSAAADVGATVREALAQLPVEAVRGDLRLFAFSGDVRPLNYRGGSWADSLQFEGARTNIARALDEVREALQQENLRGVLLVSDGQYNTGRNPLYLAERYPVPIHTVVVGDTTSRRDLQIRRITTNDIAYLGTEQPVQVRLRVEDYADEQVMVSLVHEGEVLSSSSVQLPAGTAEVQVDLAYTPRQEGLQRLTVTATRLDGEATYHNNTESFTVRVLEQKKRLLLLAAAPDPDVAAVRQLLTEDEHAEVSAFVQKSPGTFYEGSLPDRLDGYDALVLVGFPGPVADADALERVAQAAEEGTPLLFLLTRQTDVEAVQRHLQDVLPVAPEASRPGFVEAAFVPTPQGLQHPILGLPDAAPSQWRRLPPLVYNESRWRASPDARVLATTEVRGVPLDDPLLVIRQRGSLRTAALLGAGTWRWRNVPADLEAEASYWPTLLSNMLQWITTREDDRPVRVQPVEELFAGGESVELTGQVYDESLNPVEGASVEVELTAPDDTRYPYRMEPVGNGRYALDVGTLPEGTYAYRATARRDGITLGSDQGSFAVGALTLEFKETKANATLMRQIAQRSGGMFLPSEEVNALPAVLASSGSFNPTLFEEERETELRHLYGFLILVLVLLSAEWFLRKRSGLV